MREALYLPVWTVWWWPILAYFVGELTMNLNALLQPGRVALNRSLLMARNLAGAAILAGVLQAGHFVEVSSATISPEALAKLQANLDRGFGVGITAALLIFVAMAAVEAWRLRRALRLAAV